MLNVTLLHNGAMFLQHLSKIAAFSDWSRKQNLASHHLPVNLFHGKLHPDASGSGAWGNKGNSTLTAATNKIGE